jgi:hypothetical protein
MLNLSSNPVVHIGRRVVIGEAAAVVGTMTAFEVTGMKVEVGQKAEGSMERSTVMS